MWDEAGDIVGVLPKAFAFPHISAAIAVRGAALGLPMIAELMAGASSYDEMRAGAVGALRDAIDSIRAMTASPALGRDVQVFVAGFSETTGPDAFTILTKA